MIQMNCGRQFGQSSAVITYVVIIVGEACISVWVAHVGRYGNHSCCSGTPPPEG